MDNVSFDSARFSLTAWYVGILAVILFAFSFALYSGEQHDFTRIIVQRDFGTRPARFLNAFQRAEVNEQAQALRHGFLLNLLGVDVIILLVGGLLSYFLAGKTLSPIHKTVERQKELLADVSHEIRTPLAAIQTATEVSLRSKNKSKEDYKHVLYQVKDESKRLTKMANDLLFLSRMQEKTGIFFKTVSLSDIVDETVSSFSPMGKEKKIAITTHVEKNVFVRSDANSLRQLVMIFLDNAVKYTAAGGKIMVSVARIPRPTLRVADTGIGISETDQKRIFERFFRVDASRSQDGNGLGLAIAREIIAAHKAKVRVESSVGKGTAFEVVFPQ